MIDKIKKPKEKHKKEMDSYGKQVNEHIEKYGNDNCDYLIHNRLMSNYHRGAVNAFIELERML